MSDARERNPQKPAQPDSDPKPRRRLKSEDEMAKGKDYELHSAAAHFEYDPARHRASEEGGEPQ